MGYFGSRRPNVTLTGNSGLEGMWDTIFGVNDDSIIDLSCVSEIELGGSSTSSDSMLANMIKAISWRRILRYRGRSRCRG
jgi:hypothetical protein